MNGYLGRGGGGGGGRGGGAAARAAAMRRAAAKKSAEEHGNDASSEETSPTPDFEAFFAAAELSSPCLPLGAWDRQLGQHYTDYAFPDGYTYRLYKETGGLLIVQSPRSKVPVKVTDPKAKNAILAEIEKAKAERRVAVIEGVAKVGTSIVKDALAKKPAPAGKKPKVEDEEVEASPEKEKEDSAFPIVPVVGGVLALVGIAWLANR